jgi:hypothetical protein
VLGFWRRSSLAGGVLSALGLNFEHNDQLTIEYGVVGSVLA